MFVSLYSLTKFLTDKATWSTDFDFDNDYIRSDIDGSLLIWTDIC